MHAQGTTTRKSTLRGLDYRRVGRRWFDGALPLAPGERTSGRGWRGNSFQKDPRPPPGLTHPG